MSTMTILIADDDPVIIKFLRANLEVNHYRTLAAMNGKEALEMVEKELPDLVLLDIMMPEIDGFEVCRRLREWSHIPIIMLTARGEERDKVKCLDLGADDYISKPFSVQELLARVRVVLRRTRIGEAPAFQLELTFGELTINFAERRVTISGIEVKLSPTEYELLRELALNAGKVLTYPHLLQMIWGPEYRDEREYLHVFIGRLRAKLKGALAGKYIITVPGVGYKVESKE